MNTLRPVPPPHRASRWALAAVACAAASLVLTACGVGGDPTTNAERVTVTESVTPTSSPASTPTSDVAGRTYDAGTVTRVSTVDGELVLQLDRWTVKGVSDAALAKEGISVTPHTGARFTNQNNDRLRTVPVAPGATLVVNRCIRSGDQLGLQSTPQDAAEWLQPLGGKDSSTVLLLTYDASGRVVRMDTDPRC